MPKPVIKSDGRFFVATIYPSHSGGTSTNEHMSDPRPNGWEPQGAGQHDGSVPVDTSHA